MSHVSSQRERPNPSRLLAARMSPFDLAGSEEDIGVVEVKARGMTCISVDPI